jgi:hypothetical protein
MPDQPRYQPGPEVVLVDELGALGVHIEEPADTLGVLLEFGGRLNHSTDRVQPRQHLLSVPQAGHVIADLLRAIVDVGGDVENVLDQALQRSQKAQRRRTTRLHVVRAFHEQRNGKRP